MKWHFYLVLILSFFACVAKNQPVSHLSTPDYFILRSDIQMMDMDHLGNIYVVDGSDRLFRFDTTGQLTYTVVNNNLGHIHSIDVGNPFKILAFYKDQQTILLYDNTLSEIQRIPLIKWELQDVTAANLSSDNAIWVFDGSKKILMKMSDKGVPVLTSDPFDILNTPTNRPDFIYDADQFLLLKETGKPIALFNDFGNYLRTLNDIGEYFSMSNKALVFLSGLQLRSYDLTSQKFDSFSITQSMPDQKVFYYRDRLYIHDQKGIYLIRVQ